jgi:hypothetical protein
MIRFHDQGTDVTAEPSTSPQPSDWADEFRLEVLLARPEVQSMVSACAHNARASMSGEEFLRRFANTVPLLAPVPGARSAFLNAAARGHERGLSRGHQTGKSQSAEFAAPIGHVITAVLCSLARNSQAVTGTEQLEDGCILTADIPSDRKTFGGILTIEIGPTPNGTAVEGTATIPGQVYDWGKSKKVLATLIADVPALLPA